MAKKARASGRSDAAFDPGTYVPDSPHRRDSVERLDGVVSWEASAGVLCFRSASRYAFAFLLGPAEGGGMEALIVVLNALRPGKRVAGFGRHAMVRRTFEDAEAVWRAVHRTLARPRPRR